jgi:hypothetical protein
MVTRFTPRASLTRGSTNRGPAIYDERSLGAQAAAALQKSDSTCADSNTAGDGGQSTVRVRFARSSATATRSNGDGGCGRDDHGDVYLSRVSVWTLRQSRGNDLRRGPGRYPLRRHVNVAVRQTQKRKIALQRRSVTRSQFNSRTCRVAQLPTLPPRSTTSTPEPAAKSP